MRRRGRPSSSTGQVRWIIGAFLFIAASPLIVAGEPIDGNQPSPIDESLGAIRACISREPAPWPDAWQQEYIGTIRQAIAPDPNTAQYAKRLQILRDGFPLYWTAQKFSPDRSHFEVRRAQIRWYVENLMNAELPGEKERQTLRRQYEDLANHAATRLVTQFSFLDPNMVQRAKADHLAECHRNIDAPLLPIFLHRFSGDEIEQIKGCWHGQRYVRIDVWQQLETTPETSPRNPGETAVQTHPDYRLTQRSFGLLRASIWSVAAPSPEYLQTAVTNGLDLQRQRFFAESHARREEMRLSVGVIQTEYLSFLFGVLLETASSVADNSTEDQPTSVLEIMPKGR